MDRSGRIARILCAIPFTLIPASAYTITSAQANVSYYTYPPDGFPVYHTATCSQSSESYSECQMSDPAYRDLTGGRALSTADDVVIFMQATAGVGAPAAGTDAEASASLQESFAFVPDAGTDVPVQVQFLIDCVGLQSGDAYLRATFDGKPWYYNAIVTEEYSGGPINIDAELSIGAFSDYGFDSSGSEAQIQFHIRTITLFDANGDPVPGKLILLPEPAYGLPLGALASTVAFIGSRRRGWFRA